MSVFETYIHIQEGKSKQLETFVGQQIFIEKVYAMSKAKERRTIIIERYHKSVIKCEMYVCNAMCFDSIKKKISTNESD